MSTSALNRARCTARTTARPATVCFSFGMGVDSATIIHEWITHPTSRDFDWQDCVVVTAMTGDEYPATENAMNAVVLPLFRRVGLRYVQIARAGQASSAGYEVLDDSTCPQRMYMRGTRWRLSDELHAAATVPQVAGGRRCSARAKGEHRAGPVLPQRRHGQRADPRGHRRCSLLTSLRRQAREPVTRDRAVVPRSLRCHSRIAVGRERSGQPGAASSLLAGPADRLIRGRACRVASCSDPPEGRGLRAVPRGTDGRGGRC
jgi:hypothetical protein